MISQKLWQELESLVPSPKRSPNASRPPCDDRAAFNGILFVLMTGIPWEDLPQELGFGSGMTCWRRVRQWQREGVLDRLHQALLHRLRHYDQIDWGRASIDGGNVASPQVARRTAATDQGKLGSKRHVLTSAFGVPLAILVSGANRHDSMFFDSVIDAVRAVGGLQGRPRRRPNKLHADKGYDYAKCRKALRERGIQGRIARRGVESSERLGRHRWVG